MSDSVIARMICRHYRKVARFKRRIDSEDEDYEVDEKAMHGPARLFLVEYQLSEPGPRLVKIPKARTRRNSPGLSHVSTVSSASPLLTRFEQRSAMHTICPLSLPHFIPKWQALAVYEHKAFWDDGARAFVE